MQPGAPVLHDKGPESRIQHPERNIVLELHGGVGDVERGFAEADVALRRAPMRRHRAQHAQLETHCSIAWIDETDRLNVRTSSQTPFLTQAKLCYLFDLRSTECASFCERVGGGFGAKQEMVTEDLCALAALKTGKPGATGNTRGRSSFTAAPRGIR